MNNLYQIYLISDATGETLDRIFIAIKAQFKGQIIWDKTKPDGTYRKLLSIRRIKELGWSAKISLDDGIHQTFSQFNTELKK